jgi:hypothetical protein
MADQDKPRDPGSEPLDLRNDENLKARLATRLKKRQRLLAKVVKLAEQRVMTRRYRTALRMARKLYAQGVGTSECAECSGLSKRVVWKYTRDIYRQRMAAKEKGGN